VVAPASELPRVGEPVRVTWGRAIVTGRVVESYSGVRPRVVVEVEPGEVDDSSTTITVPISSLEPFDSSSSEWAQSIRYERAVAEALSRVADDLDHIEVSPLLGKHEIDLLAHFKEGQRVVVEVKAHPVTRTALRDVLARTKAIAREEDAAWLVVLPGVISTDLDATSNPLRVAIWSGEEDDDSLRRALQELRTTKSPGAHSGPLS
jgi:hypothetical protein